MELILLTVFCYAIGTETTAYNRKIAFDAKKVAFTMKDAVVPVKDTVKETKTVIEAQEDQSLTEGKTIVFADRYLGNPYVLGGRDIETGVDCAGFVNYVFTHGPAGKHWKSMNVGGLYHEIGGKSVSVDKMKPGISFSLVPDCPTWRFMREMDRSCMQWMKRMASAVQSCSVPMEVHTAERKLWMYAGFCKRG